MNFEISTTLSALKFVSGDSNHVCRLCLCSTENRELTFEDTVNLQKSYFDETITFQDIFDELGVNIEPLLPQVLCVDCANITINSYLFQKVCQYSNEKWDEVLTQLQQSFSQSDSMSPKVKTAYVLINKHDNTVFTSKKICVKRSKKLALAKIKSILSNRSKYKTKKKTASFRVICEECGEKFNSNIQLSKHMKVHKKGQSRIPCPQCAKYFATRMQLEDHAERVHYPKNVQCSQCAKMFSTARMLRRHEKIHHIAAICKLCFVQFPSKNLLRAHLDKHDVNKCDQCGKTFINRHTFKLHLKICGNPNTKQPSFFCDICNKGYARKNSLRTHLKTDHGFGQVLSCNWCNKKFDAVSRLKNHIVKHTRERNFDCEQCGGKFVTQAALLYHTRLHTGEKPFPCDLCSESFLSASRRMEHKRRKHFEPTKECLVCHTKFVTGHQLRKHVQRHYNPHSKLYVPISEEPTDVFGIQ